MHSVEPIVSLSRASRIGLDTRTRVLIQFMTPCIVDKAFGLSAHTAMTTFDGPILITPEPSLSMMQFQDVIDTINYELSTYGNLTLDSIYCLTLLQE